MHSSYVTVNPCFEEDLDKLREITERHEFAWLETDLSEGNHYALSFVRSHARMSLLETVIRIFVAELKMQRFNIWDTEMKSE